MIRSEEPHISVCIPTYRRPNMLGRCLEALLNQEISGFTYSVVVVDNDIEQSARQLMHTWRRRSSFRLCYDVEPVRNISLTRNRALSNSQGDLIAFIDDDEFPEPTWLLKLFNAYECFSVDGVFGPVVPFYEGTPPKWLIRSGLCVRTSFQTGTILSNSKYMRTGNVLFGRHIFRNDETPFDPRLGRTGGEDTVFFTRMLRRGCSFVWCKEARVYEEVPQQRQRRSYFISRAFIRGVNTADREPWMSIGTLKSIGAVIAYTLSLPVLLVAGNHLFMNYLVKDCHHVAKLLAHCGVRLARERII